MTTPVDDLMATIRRDLAAWHETHPDATLAEIEMRVEERLHRLRTALIQECTGTTREEAHPICAQCGVTMVPRSRSTRLVVFPGEAAVPLERTYVVCPACGAGLFPPG